MKIFITILLFFSFVAQGFGDNCQQAKQLYEKGNATKVNTEKIQLYQKSIDLCPSFGAYYMLGLTYMKMNRFKDAVQPLKEAVKLDQTKAQAFLLLGDAYMQLDDVENALFYFKLGLSLQEKPSPTYQKRLNQMKIKSMKKGTDAKTIQGSLERGIKHRAKGFNITPAKDVKIHFDFDKYTLSNKGKKEVAKLGKALKELLKKYNPKGIRDEVSPFKPGKPSSHAYKFKLIGHTDSRGSDQYNDTLSLNRAKTVKQFLNKHYRILEEVIEVAGKGKREFLVPDARTEVQHALNRRVEVIVIGH